MRFSSLLFIALGCLFLSCKTEVANTYSNALPDIITSYYDHEAYDENPYTLGLCIKAHYEAETNFASIESATLSVTDQISKNLLLFKLRYNNDFFEFERYLNPILSDFAFHNSLHYMAPTLQNYHPTKIYLNKLYNRYQK